MTTVAARDIELVRGFAEAVVCLADEGWIEPQRAIAFLHYQLRKDEQPHVQIVLDEWAWLRQGKDLPSRYLAAAWREYLKSPGETYPGDPAASRAWQRALDEATA